MYGCKFTEKLLINMDGRADHIILGINIHHQLLLYSTETSDVYTYAVGPQRQE